MAKRGRPRKKPVETNVSEDIKKRKRSSRLCFRRNRRNR